MSFKIGDWVMTSKGARQVDGITPSGQIRVDGDRYKRDLRVGDCYYPIGDFHNWKRKLRHATEAEIAARKMEIEAQFKREQIQKARAKMAREFLLMLNWQSVSDAEVLRIAEQQGFKV